MLRSTALAFAFSSLLIAADKASETLDAAALSAKSPLVAALSPSSGSWREEPVTAADRAAERRKVEEAGKRFLAAVKAAKDGPNAAAQTVLADLVGMLDDEDAPPARPDVVDPGFARRAVRGGALRGLTVDPAATEVEKALAEASRFRAVAAFAGPQGARLEERRDAFGAGGWVLTGARTAYAIPHNPVFFLPAPDLVLVVDLPAKADPAVDAAKAVSAAVSTGSEVVARWNAKDDKLTADAKAWRTAVPEPRGRGLAADLLPPHLVLKGFDGELLRLVTRTGSVVPPRAGKAGEANRFLTEAAKALPDTAHLDLVGQHLFRYVYDSPDPRFPGIIGNGEVKGDIHQTAAQTIGVSAGGMCRGDCDDLAEFYQTIAEKQGRLGHLLILPSHTAFAAARKDGKEWVVEVMQTGPTLAFRGADLPEALKAAHVHFDPSAPFAADRVGLLLRFSGENQRGSFGLGWRIFAEPAYARTMIDVQRDWQYQTYARAIAKMEKLIAAGDRDPANLLELSGLYTMTGQWTKAAQALQDTLDAQKDDPVSRLQTQLQLAGALRRDGRPDEARTLLGEAAGALSGLAKQLGNGLPRIGMAVSLAQLNVGDVEGARTTLGQTAFMPLAQMTAQLAQLVSQPQFNRRDWTGDGRLAPIRGLLGTYISCLLSHLTRGGTGGDEQVAKNMRAVVDAWLAKLAFLDAESASDALGIYASAARVHALDLTPQELARRVAAAEPPKDAKRDHLARPAAPAGESLEADLPWIRISPQWWLGEVNRALRGGDEEEEDDDHGAGQRLDPAKVDRARVAAAGKGAAAALESCRALGLTGQSIEFPAHLAVLVAAAVGGDDKTVRERLRFVKKQNDKRLRDATAIVLGRVAIACDDARWQAVLKAWADEVDYKPKWFAIAWNAAVTGAPAQALATAKMAAERFKDDASFAEEYAFMQQLFGKK